jgi:hypothetical protein
MAATPWVPAGTAQTTAAVPVRIPGGPVVRRRRPVYRARLSRAVDGTQVLDTCGHNHVKRTAAATCGKAMAASLNWQARTGHVAWPAYTSPLRSRYGSLTADTDLAKIAPGAYPLRAVCQPCGQPIWLPHQHGAWVHVASEEQTARYVAAVLVAALGDGAEAYAAQTAALAGGAR